MTPQLQAAVDAYDKARISLAMKWHGSIAQPMSDANKESIAPMILAAIMAYQEATGR